jgi:hypothetical protein
VRVDDRDAILLTLMSYGRFLDEYDDAEWLDLFAADARFDLRGTIYEGRAGLEAFLAQRTYRGPRKNFLGSFALSFDGDDRCVATGDTMALRPSADGIRVVFVGRFRDELRRDADRWRFTQKVVIAADGFGL